MESPIPSPCYLDMHVYMHVRHGSSARPLPAAKPGNAQRRLHHYSSIQTGSTEYRVVSKVHLYRVAYSRLRKMRGKHSLIGIRSACHVVRSMRMRIPPVISGFPKFAGLGLGGCLSVCLSTLYIVQKAFFLANRSTHLNYSVSFFCHSEDSLYRSIQAGIHNERLQRKRLDETVPRPRHSASTATC